MICAIGFLPSSSGKRLLGANQAPYALISTCEPHGRTSRAIRESAVNIDEIRAASHEAGEESHGSHVRIVVDLSPTEPPFPFAILMRKSNEGSSVNEHDSFALDVVLVELSQLQLPHGPSFRAKALYS
jgi:hypothetical protein